VTLPAHFLGPPTTCQQSPTRFSLSKPRTLSGSTTMNCIRPSKHLGRAQPRGSGQGGCNRIYPWINKSSGQLAQRTPCGRARGHPPTNEIRWPILDVFGFPSRPIPFQVAWKKPRKWEPLGCGYHYQWLAWLLDVFVQVAQTAAPPTPRP
jgi:hypothetical protein